MSFVRVRISAIFIGISTLIVGVLVALPMPSAQANASAGGRFVSVTGYRLADTTTGVGGYSTAFAAGTERTFQVLGSGGASGVPSTGVSAVVLDVSVSSATASATSIYAYPSDGTRSETAFLRAGAGVVPATNTVIVAPGSDGKIGLKNSDGSTNLNVDVQGYFTTSTTSGGGFVVTDPTRAYSSSQGVGTTAGQLNGSTTYTIDLKALGNLPSNASSVFANVRVGSATDPGKLTVVPSDASTSGPSSVDYRAMRAEDSGVAIKLGPDGKIKIRSNAATASHFDVLIDIEGYFTSTGDGAQGGLFTPLPGVKIYDSADSASIGAGETRTIPINGLGGIPDDGTTGSAAVTVTALSWTVGGALTLFNPDEGRTGGVSTLGFSSDSGPDASVGATTTAFIEPSIDGKISIYNGATGAVRVLLTTQGWFSNSTPAQPAAPSVATGDGAVPRISTVLSDPDGGMVTPHVVVTHDGSPIIDADAPAVISGSTWTYSTIPLFDGAFTVTVKASDGRLSSAPSNATTFTVVASEQGVARAISVADESTFVSDATLQGVGLDMAKLGIWNADIASGIPTAVDTTEISPQFDDNAPDEVAGDTNLTPDDESQGESAISPDFVTTQSAETGLCKTTSTLYKGSATAKFKNRYGTTLATVTMKTRWCGATYHYEGSNLVLENRVDSWYSPKLDVTISNLGSLTGWKKGETDFTDKYYYKWNGAARGGHFNYQRQNLRFCPVRVGFCDDKYARMKIWAHYSGGYVRRNG